MILIHRLLVKLPVKHCHAATLGKLFTPLCPSQTEQLSTGQTAVTPYGWEGVKVTVNVDLYSALSWSHQ